MYQKSSWFAEEIFKIRAYGKTAAFLLYTFAALLALTQYFCLICIILGQGNGMSPGWTSGLALTFTLLKGIEVPPHSTRPRTSEL